MRAFGVRSAAGARPQLWMAAFFPDRASGERSSPAFRLPFQDLATGNHIAQWAEIVDRQTCDDPSDCGTGELCDGGVCLPDID